MNGVYVAAIAALVAFCFRWPDFPRRLAPRLGVRGAAATRVFLLAYWIAVPVVIHRLMAQIRLE